MNSVHRDSSNGLRVRFLILGFLAIFLTVILLIIRFLASDDRGIIADLHVYYLSSRWIVSPGRLFVDFPSEYPLFANLWFAIPRIIAIFFGSELRSYTLLYVVLAAGLYGFFFYFAVNLVDRQQRAPASSLEFRSLSAGLLLSALSPAILQLVMLRYDVLPATLIFFAFILLSRGRLNVAASLLGFAIAAKVYPIVYLPAFIIYAMRIAGFRAAFYVAALSLLPFMLMSALTLSFAGVEGFLSPFLFQSSRSFDSASIFGFLSYIFDPQRITIMTDPFVKIVTLVLALFGGLIVTANVSSLARVTAFQTCCLLLISPITSPQFLIWVLPILLFTAHRQTNFLFICFAWFSNFWFLLETDGPELIFEILLLVNLLFKFALVISSASGAFEWRSRTTAS